MNRRVLPAGDRALLVEFDSAADVLAFDAAVASREGLIDVVPAARTVLVRFAPGVDLSRMRREFEQLPVRAVAGTPVGDRVEIPTVYDGADLVDVAAHCHLSVDGLIAAHTGQDWTVAFCGFAPGFAYLTGPDERLAALPRRATPRTRVPVGSVALAGGFSAVYPAASPGGWQLLGRTSLPVFDVDHDPPALLRPGQRVRFVAVP